MKYLVPFKVSLQEYEGLITSREYWDDLSEEWNNSTIEEKIVRLSGFVKMGGNLNKIINRYAKSHDDYIRRRIQYCVGMYILKIIDNDITGIFDHKLNPLARRVKRLVKEELVKLLINQLKTSVHEDICMDENQKIHENWTIKYTRKSMTPMELLDKIDSKYWNHDYSTYDRRPDVWWNNEQRSLW